jgi:hypothetical protein
MRAGSSPAAAPFLFATLAMLAATAQRCRQPKTQYVVQLRLTDTKYSELKSVLKQLYLTWDT